MAGSFRCVCGYDAGDATLNPEIAANCPGCGGRFQPVNAEPEAIARLFDSAHGEPTDYHLDVVEDEPASRATDLTSMTPS